MSFIFNFGSSILIVCIIFLHFRCQKNATVTFIEEPYRLSEVEDFDIMIEVPACNSKNKIISVIHIF